MKKFETIVAVSITSGRLLCDMDDIYALLGYMTRDEPFTHQLPRFSNECKPWLLRQHPHLAGLTEEVVKLCEAGDVQVAIRHVESSIGVMIDVERIPMDDHDRIDPVSELVR